MTSRTPSAPNVVLIMTDQQRWDTLGCYGNEVIETTNLDQLAFQGTVFTAAYSATPSCIPARASLMTGLSPWHTGILGMGQGQPTCANLGDTLPAVLARAGYHTQAVGKLHLTPQRSLQGFHHAMLDESARVEDFGFESDYARWFDRHRTGEYGRYDHGIDRNSWVSRPWHAPEYLHPTNWTVNESIDFLERRDPTRSFFLMTSFARPHSPYDPPDFYFDLYAGKPVPEPAVGGWAEANDVPADALDPNAWRGRRSPEQIRRARVSYYGLVHHIDHQVGRLLSYLREHGLYENTLIMFTSDHGDMLGDHHLWRKTHAYEGSAHIPLVVKLPDTPHRRIRVDRPVTLYDVMPTVLDAVGVPPAGSLDGVSMLPLIQQDDPPWRPYLHGEHDTFHHPSQENQYLTDGHTKYIWFPRTDEEQLFDLDADRYERHDLSADPRCVEELRSWRRRLVGVLAERHAGLTKDDELVCQQGSPPLISPYAVDRTGPRPGRQV